jgi:4-diphosphocytidyl-2-C-methyl-D-erythritol kinase
LRGFSRALSYRHARLRALAKVNLSLKVLHRRPDDYHELRTVFQTVGLHDTIEVDYHPARRTRLTLESEADIPDNLVLRAARLFLDETRTHAIVDFRLKKRIPMGGGLGGGSSDAAAVLLALPVLSGKSLTLEQLSRLAAQLGSDVPYFLHGGTTLGVGRGEELYPLPEQPSRPVLVLAPHLHVSTRDAYRALGRSLTSGPPSHKLNIFQSFVWRESGVSASENDFERAVFGQHPKLRFWRRELEKSGADPARLSGSGAALFGVFQTTGELRNALPRFANQPLDLFSTRTVTRAAYRAQWWNSLREHITGKSWPLRSRYGQ